MKFLLIPVVVFLFSSAHAEGKLVSYEELRAKHFASIHEISSCGTWGRGKTIGEFRLIKAYIDGHAMVFVDMVRPSKDGNSFIVDHGFTFPELNNEQARIWLEDISCMPRRKNIVVITAKAEDGHEVKRFRFRITINAKKKRYTYREYR
ncbi:MAG: hypothetical protein OEZ33_12140 [Gammaproteobacteria bacterium]|nr:hypothetical protein [Gammaproteobacteria bacterium]MDH5778958.1 hypothetical protein [Gammaproteobacteria bacterium]